MLHPLVCVPIFEYTMSVFLKLLLLLLLSLVHVQQNQAGRILDMEKQLWMQSLEKVPVPPSGPSGCTYIPGTGGNRCPPVNEMNVAGNAFRHHAAAAYPHHIVPLGLAANH
ncbi:uncharacterized protein LOC129307645 [Prosopis cineraria]|uniref:uncharacterized protein LOC129307645 n=1 Tax=Prosopis cineraria TaxID=364024 RepID=UPI0024105918|nr:uncharacterized protein LOC129307645 [Prosopis cineraria]